MRPRSIRFLASLTSFSLIAPLARAAEPAPLPEPAVIQAARAVTQPRAPLPADQPPWERDDTLAHVSLAIGGVGFLAAGVSFLLKKRRAPSDDDCRFGKCQPRSREDVAMDKALGNATTIGTLVGVAGGVTGVLLLIGGKGPDRNRKGVSALVTPSYFGLKVRF